MAGAQTSSGSVQPVDPGTIANQVGSYMTSNPPASSGQYAPMPDQSLTPMQMLQAYRSGASLEQIAAMSPKMGRPAQFLPPSLPQYNYSAPKPAASASTNFFGQPVATSGNIFQQVPAQPTPGQPISQYQTNAFFRPDISGYDPIYNSL